MLIWMGSVMMEDCPLLHLSQGAVLDGLEEGRGCGCFGVAGVRVHGEGAAWDGRGRGLDARGFQLQVLISVRNEISAGCLKILVHSP